MNEKKFKNRVSEAQSTSDDSHAHVHLLIMVYVMYSSYIDKQESTED